MPMIIDEVNNEIYHVDEHGRLMDPALPESEWKELKIITTHFIFCEHENDYIALEECEMCDYCEVAGEKRYCTRQE